MILLYHKVALVSPSPWWVSVDDFNRQMAGLAGRKVVYLAEYDPNDSRHAVITFDGVYSNVFQYAVPVLQKWGYPFELFVIGDYLGASNDFDAGEPPARFADIDELMEMVSAGGRIQWHSASHARLGDGLAQIDQELLVPDELRARFPAPHFEWFAYPHGSNNPDVVAAVRERFAGAVACADGQVGDQYRLPRQEALPGLKTSSTRVSVIIPNYNYGYFLQDAIDSVVRQTIPADEILVIDDCSTDDSRDVIERNAGRVRLCINDRNLGIVENFRKAVQLTTGEYVVLLGADNRFRATFLERCKAVLDADPDLAVAYPDISLFGPYARLLAAQLKKCQRFRIEKVFEDTSTGEEVYHWIFPDGTRDLAELMKEGNCIHGSAMFRRNAYDDVGGYRSIDGIPEDRDLFGRIIEAGYRVARIPEPLLDYRQHSPDQANTRLSTGLQLAARSAELFQLRQELKALTAERRQPIAETDDLHHDAKGSIALWDPARLKEWSTTISGNKKIFDHTRVHVHPNLAGEDAAAVLIETALDGQAVFRCRLALLNEHSRPVRFWVTVMQGEKTVLQASRELSGGLSEDWAVRFDPVVGACVVILATEMADSKDPTSHAWACFEQPMLERKGH